MSPTFVLYLTAAVLIILRGCGITFHKQTADLGWVGVGLAVLAYGIDH